MPEEALLKSNKYAPISCPPLSNESEDAYAPVRSELKGEDARSIPPLQIPQGELSYPYINWPVDKLSMEWCMHDYAKQKGFAVNTLKECGGVI